jgi:hypothetical protein
MCSAYRQALAWVYSSFISTTLFGVGCVLSQHRKFLPQLKYPLLNTKILKSCYG